ncbi:hypothetical protein MIR68_004851 [Amoeboaphelidium protococcarum]|nr:hypothetical protein MIR68_004851 [Amoeboaphelidium protococcarum]
MDSVVHSQSSGDIKQNQQVGIEATQSHIESGEVDMPPAMIRQSSAAAAVSASSSSSSTVLGGVWNLIGRAYSSVTSYVPYTNSYRVELFKRAKDAEINLLRNSLGFYKGEKSVDGDSFDVNVSADGSIGSSNQVQSPRYKYNPDVQAWTELVDIGNDVKVNTFVMENNKFSSYQDNQKRHLVLTHGYGSGLGMYYRMFPYLSFAPDYYKVYSFDLLGMGLSSRVALPPKVCKSKSEVQKSVEQDLDENLRDFDMDDVQKVEKYFVDSMEKWRVSMGIDKMVLGGHSLGGYLVSCYASQYPQHVEKLLLISPAGMNARLDFSKQIDSFSFTRRSVIKTVITLWDWNLTPQSVVRMGGSLFGERLVRGYVQNRFSTNVDTNAVKGEDGSIGDLASQSSTTTNLETIQDDDPARLSKGEMEDLIKYIHGMSSLEGSGEFALSRLLFPGGWAKRVLTMSPTYKADPIKYGEPAVPLPVEAFQNSLLNLVSQQHQIPIVFYFGQFDFMDKSTPSRMIELSRRSRDESKKLFHDGSDVVVVPDCGHQLIVQNPEYLCKDILKRLSD